VGNLARKVISIAVSANHSHNLLSGLCDECYLAPQETIANLTSRIQANERRLANAHRICVTCTGSGPGDEIRCESLDCPWLYSRKRAESKGEFLAAIQELLDELNERVETNTLIEHDDEHHTPDARDMGSLDDDIGYYDFDSLQMDSLSQ
jgi:DNA polymerase zeta